MTSNDLFHSNHLRAWNTTSADGVYIDKPGKHHWAQISSKPRPHAEERNRELEIFFDVQRNINRQRALEPKVQLRPSHSTIKPGSKVTKMRKQKFKSRRGRRRRPTSASLRSRLVPFRMVRTVTTKDGLYTHAISMKEVAVEYLKTFDEFRCAGFSIRFVPSAITSEGVYTTVMLDGLGFGTMNSTPPAPTWFTRLGDMPGSSLRHCASGFTHRWKPTSPPSRTWIRLHNNDFPLATVYVSTSNAANAVRGAIHITGSIRVRGEYNAAVNRIMRYNSICDLDAMTMEEVAEDM